MARPKFFREEVDIKLRRQPAGHPQRLVPWWVRALRRIRVSGAPRRQARGSLGRGQTWRKAGGELRTYARRSVVKASFSRNRKSGAWTAHARYLSRPGAQQELTRGLGFDSTREGIDIAATVRDWEKQDQLMWRFIVSPEDADRLNLRDHVRELVGQMESHLELGFSGSPSTTTTPTTRMSIC